MKLSLLIHALLGFTALQAQAQDLVVTRPSLSVAEVKELPCVKAHTCYLAGYAESASTSNLPVVWKFEEQNIRLLGSGFRNKTGESLAIACVDEKRECTRFQFINYINANEVYRLGPEFTVIPQTVNGKELGPKESIAHIVQQVVKNGKNRNQRGGWLFIGGAVAAGGVALATMVTWPLAVMFGLGLIVAGPGKGDPMMVDFLTPVQSVIEKDGGATLTYQQGWNWSSQPKKISEKAYRAIIGDLLMSTVDNRSPSYESIPWMFEKNRSVIKANLVPNRSAFDSYMQAIKHEQETGNRAAEWVGTYDPSCGYGDSKPKSVSLSMADDGKNVELNVDGVKILMNRVYNEGQEQSYFFNSANNIYWTQEKVEGDREYSRTIRLKMEDGKKTISFTEYSRFKPVNGSRYSSASLGSRRVTACLK